MVRGYHKYKDIWEAEVGENLVCERETGNVHDLYAVSVIKSGVVVGHVPRKISSTCSLFLRHYRHDYDVKLGVVRWFVSLIYNSKCSRLNFRGICRTHENHKILLPRKKPAIR